MGYPQATTKKACARSTCARLSLIVHTTLFGQATHDLSWQATDPVVASAGNHLAVKVEIIPFSLKRPKDVPIPALLLARLERLNHILQSTRYYYRAS